MNATDRRSSPRSATRCRRRVRITPPPHRPATVELVPVVLGSATPLFADLGGTPVQLEGPFAVVQGTGVTHLRYRVKK